MTRSSLTYAAVTSDRQANTEEHQGSPGTETKYRQGESSSTHDTLRRESQNKMLHGFISLPAGSSFFEVFILIENTNLLVVCIPYLPSFFSLLPKPPLPQLLLLSPPTSLPILYHRVFFLLSREHAAAWIRTPQSCQSQDFFPPSFIFKHGIQHLSCHSDVESSPCSLHTNLNPHSIFPPRRLAPLLSWQHFTELMRHYSVARRTLTPANAPFNRHSITSISHLGFIIL